METRRTLLQSGAAAIAGGLAATAGCTDAGPAEGGDSGGTEETSRDSGTHGKTESPGGEGSTERKPDLGIGRVRFLQEKPEGYRQYTEAPDATYEADESIWIYVEPTGVAFESTEGGERRFELRLRVSVTGPEGEEIRPLTETVSDTIPESADEPDVFVFAQYTVRNPGVGDYTVEISIADELSRGRASETATFSIEDETLRLLSQFRERVEERTDAEIQRDSLRDGTLSVTFSTPHSRDERPFYDDAAEMALAYAAVVDEGLSTDSLRLRPVEGDDGDDSRTDEDGAENDGEEEVRRPITIDAERARSYNADELSREEYVQPLYDRYLTEIFRQMIDEGTDAEIDRVSIRDGTLSLDYETPHALSDDVFHEDVGYIVGAYAGVIDEGLSTETLRVRGTDGEGEEFFYAAETETAKTYVDGEITEEEYVDRVYESFRPRDWDES